MAIAHPPTRPVRVREDDHKSLRALARLEGRVPADIIHRALAEYIARHGAELSSRFARAQRAIASGRVEEVLKLLDPEAEDRAVAELESELAALR